MRIARLDHYNIKTTRPDETIAFYTEVLGLVNAPERRPAVGRPGTWILIDGHPVIHVNFVTENRAARTGALDHLGLIGEDYDAFKAHLVRLGVPFEEGESRIAGLKQIYVTDPNQIRLEINFPHRFAD